jgi:hypothetical protein
LRISVEEEPRQILHLDKEPEAVGDRRSDLDHGRLFRRAAAAVRLLLLFAGGEWQVGANRATG